MPKKLNPDQQAVTDAHIKAAEAIDRATSSSAKEGVSAPPPKRTRKPAAKSAGSTGDSAGASGGGGGSGGSGEGNEYDGKDGQNPAPRNGTRFLSWMVENPQVAVGLAVSLIGAIAWLIYSIRSDPVATEKRKTAQAIAETAQASRATPPGWVSQSVTQVSDSAPLVDISSRQHAWCYTVPSGTGPEPRFYYQPIKTNFTAGTTSTRYSKQHPERVGVGVVQNEGEKPARYTTAYDDQLHGRIVWAESAEEYVQKYGKGYLVFVAWDNEPATFCGQ